NATFAEKFGVEEGGIYRVKNSVAVRTVHDGMKRCDQMDGRAACFQSEVRGIGGAVHANALQRATVFSRGGQCAGNALEHAEIRVLEGVSAGDRCSSRVVALPRSKVAIAIDQSRRLGVGQLRGKA